MKGAPMSRGVLALVFVVVIAVSVAAAGDP
jgi:hypothetical protein